MTHLTGRVGYRNLSLYLLAKQVLIIVHIMKFKRDRNKNPLRNEKGNIQTISSIFSILFSVLLMKLSYSSVISNTYTNFIEHDYFSTIKMKTIGKVIDFSNEFTISDLFNN